MDLSAYKKAKEEMLENGKKVLVAEFKSFFSNYPNIDAVRWRQYTPYFNDGDICSFSRQEFTAKVVQKNNKSEIGTAELISATEADEDGFYNIYDLNDGTPLKDALDSLENTFSSVEEIFQNTFGDGVQVTATRKGFKVEDIDHD